MKIGDWVRAKIEGTNFVSETDFISGKIMKIEEGTVTLTGIKAKWFNSHNGYIFPLLAIIEIRDEIIYD